METTLAHNKKLVTTHSNGRHGQKIRAIVVHHEAGNLTAEAVKNVFQKRKSSANYAIDVNGVITMYVDESNRAWTTGGTDPDDYSITIELANDQIGGNWHISDNTINKCAELCADICERHGIKKLYYDGKKGTLLRHCDFQATACPGEYFKSVTTEFCNYVNSLILTGNGSNSSEKDADGKLYRVQTGAFKSKENAVKYANELNSKGIKTVIKEN